MLVFGYTIIQSKIFFYKVSKGNVPTLLINNHSIVGMKLVIVFKPPIAVKYNSNQVHITMDFKKYNCYLIFPFCALHLRLSGKKCASGTKYAASKVDVIHGGKYAVREPSKS